MYKRQSIVHPAAVAFFVSILSISGTPLLPRRTAKAVWPQDVSPYRRWTPDVYKRQADRSRLEGTSDTAEGIV